MYYSLFSAFCNSANCGSIDSSVRALEGSLIRILAYSSYNKINSEDIDVDTCRNILADMISETQKEITLHLITLQVCTYYNISISQIMEKSRKPQVSFPRQVAMYLANLMIPQLSLKDIADYYHRKDHTTVLYAKRMIENQFRNDNEFRAQIESLINNIRS